MSPHILRNPPLKVRNRNCNRIALHSTPTSLLLWLLSWDKPQFVKSPGFIIRFLAGPVHPVCGNRIKTGAQCVYDVSSEKRDNANGADSSGRLAMGKRRRATPRTWEEDVDELQTIYGHLRQTGSSEETRSDPRAIEARLDKLMSMIEKIGGNKQSLEDIERHAVGPNNGVENSLLEDLRQRKARDGKPISSRPSSPRRVAVESSGDEFPIPSGQATDLVDPVGSLNLGHLSLDDGGRSRSHDTASSETANDDPNDPSAGNRRQ
ncbi:transcriptional regulator family: Fungal Specific TF [Penicillium citrinum]|uniref:Transcriptional regulator family: Fungal Specific TF n=1 Tax=Penicillium citrinum TaxID=5077 RepID=A0A9W9NIH1_PENCI|nr:transcriptional regulator family: Fungal Specific TF [Penicillium citrinum]KAJ5220574.1 transcriptional regulator family: Fungal Specific TF [Penicillium citrinum]